MIVVLGAGVAGLSLGARLARPFVILEREDQPGGLARSIQRGGFAFDHCGHVLHVRDPADRAWIETLLAGRLVAHERRAAVHLFGRLVDYPFQMHLGQLPPDVAAECLEGYFEAHDGAKPARDGESWSFRRWADATFGTGITRHFLAPYQEKLHGTPLDDLLADEVQWSVPVPSPRQVVRGALGLENPSIGYHARFEYPRAGGIGALPAALADEIRRRGRGRIELGARVVAVDLEARAVEVADGRRFPYEALVSTLPLVALIGLARGLPDTIRELALGLRASAVSCVNLGFARPGMGTRHWIYVPEPDVPFFRLGCYAAFSDVAGSSFWVEFARPHGAPRELGLERAALAGLRRLGIAREGEEPDVVDVVDVPCAYVIHDEARRRALPILQSFLERRGVHCAGRYGEWGYGSMADALAAGRTLAAALDAR